MYYYLLTKNVDKTQHFAPRSAARMLCGEKAAGLVALQMDYQRLKDQQSETQSRGGQAHIPQKRKAVLTMGYSGEISPSTSQTIEPLSKRR